MQSLNSDIREYTKQLELGEVQRAYKGIMIFYSKLRNYFERKYPECKPSALYFGYMDMTYFACTPPELKEKDLKIAIVYVHEENRFEVWLGGKNRKVQAEYIKKMGIMDLGKYSLSKVMPGVDSIIEEIIVNEPDFEKEEKLIQLIESKMLDFSKDISEIILKNKL